MLKIDSLSVYYGNVRALQDVSMRVEDGELVTLIGGNGAGKTTLLMTISGMVKPRSGRIDFLGARIDKLEPHDIVRLGLVQVAQGRQLFPAMSVAENLQLGAYLSREAEEMRQDIQRIYEYFKVLYERRKQNAGALSGGEQQMLAIARALMARPKFLLLDEPSSGLAPKVVEDLAEIIRVLHQREGLAMLFVEQNAHLALGLSERGYVLENGVIVASGSTSELSRNPIVRTAYLGL